MSDQEPTRTGFDRNRVERHLRNVRLKLMSARRELQTLRRQSSLRQDAKHGRVEIERAERNVQELEETEADLVKQLEADEATADASQTMQQSETKGESA